MEKDKIQKKVEKSDDKDTGNEVSVSVSKRNIGIFVALAVIVVVGVFVYQNMNSGYVARVNGEDITMSELDTAYDTLPAQYKAVTTKKDLLDQLVQTKVVYQKATEEGYEVSDEEATEQIELLKAGSGMTDEQFNQALIDQGVDKAELLGQYKKQIIIQKYLNDELISKIEISDEEVSDYYNENHEQFNVDESVVVRHILIGDEDLTPTERKQKAGILIASEITQDNFCEKVKEYTTDVASAETCGEYAFTKNDPLVQGFKDLSFSQGKGKIGMVQTEFGTHIIWTVDKLPARTVGFEEAKPEIENFLRNQKAGEELETFYEGLAAESDIKIKFEEL